ncbi:MAG: ribosome assembly factor SBDS [Candidatus Marsarchaeota archaeon]|jgi:ribosome maturation protein SDO1|nr:ribosome assembly factor SBDS [Candidatus Marsarchaeota archaeon]
MSSKQIIVKYTQDKEIFEIVVDSEMAYEYLSGKRTDPMSILESDEIWRDAKKGIAQSQDKIRKAFGTIEIAVVADRILKKGDVPLTTEHRNRMLEEKRRQIIEEIARNAMDPRTNAPMPKMRIENAFNEAKINVDPFKSVNEQVEQIIERLKPIIPIKIAVLRIQVLIPAEYANQSFGILKQFQMKSEEWMSNGQLKAIVEIPAGMQSRFYDKINSVSHGSAQTEIMK